MGIIQPNPPQKHRGYDGSMYHARNYIVLRAFPEWNMYGRRSCNLKHLENFCSCSLKWIENQVVLRPRQAAIK